MDTLDEKMKREITPERRHELEEYAKNQGLKLTKQEQRKAEEAWNAPVGPERNEPTAEDLRVYAEIQKEEWDIENRMESYAPKIAIEFLCVERVIRRLQEDKIQEKEDEAGLYAPTVKELKDTIAEIKTALPTTRAKTETKNAKSEPTPEYVFRRMGDKGDFWKIVFKGDELQPVRHLAGMTYIHALLSHPGKQYPVLDLYEIENPPPPAPKGKTLSFEERERFGTGGSHQTILDKTTPAQLKKANAVFEAKLTDPDLSETQREHIKDQIEIINKTLLNCRVAKATRGAIFEGKATKQPRQTVSKSIEAAIDALANMEHGQELAKHLRYVIRKGKTLMYPSGLSWS
ncbi:MAG: hypothetical protein NT011_07865 [Kiritimatiellaeota bacterium]|nr:hypothetical protein [Kiritimatiellota bacterium]